MHWNRICFNVIVTDVIVGGNGGNGGNDRWCAASNPPEFHSVFPALWRRRWITFTLGIRTVAARWKSRVTLAGACGHQRQPRVTTEIRVTIHQIILSIVRGNNDFIKLINLMPLVQSLWGLQLESSAGIVDGLSAVTSRAFWVSQTLMKPLVSPDGIVVNVNDWNCQTLPERKQTTCYEKLSGRV